MFNTDSYGNIYFPAGVSVGNYPITLNTPTHVLVAGVGGMISRVATSQLISNTDVTSVFGRQGAITAQPGDYNTDMVKEETNLYFSNARARASISLTTVGSTGPATYNAVTGVLNVPQYQNEFNGVSSFNTRTGAVTLTALDITTALTYTPVAIETDPIWAAQKVLYYTKVESDATFSLIGHVHTIANITGLQTALNGKEPSIEAGTTSQYWRGDKTWQTLPTYSLPIASATVLGGIKVGTNLSINATTGVLDATFTYTLPTASTTVLGGVKVDGTTITINGSGVISGANTYSLPTATATILGGVKIGGGVTITSGVISVSTNYEAPITAGTTAQYWRGDKSWQTLPVYTLAGLGGLPLAGGIMTGAITLKEGAANGLKFPNDVFGGSGDTAGMRLIARSGEAMSLEVYLTNDADDWFNIAVPNDSAAKVNGNTIWHAGNLTNLNQLTNGPGYLTSLSGAVLTTNNTSLNTDSRNTRGVTRLYRRDDDSDYSVQTHWTGSHWFIRGYNGDTLHAEARVGYSDSTGSVAWTNVSGRPSALSSFTNDLGNYGGWYSSSGGTISGNVTINGTSNVPLTINEAQPYIHINATGSTNTAGIRVYPSLGYDATIGNFNGGALNLVASSLTVAKVTSNAGVIFYTSTTGPITSIGSNTSASIVFINSSSSNKTWDMSLYNNDWILNESNIAPRIKVLAGGGVYADAFYEFSDKRFKTLVEENPIITGIESVTAKLYIKEGKEELGYYAQDFEGVLNSALLKDKDDVLSLSYRQVHTAKIASLEKRIAELEAKLNTNGL